MLNIWKKYSNGNLVKIEWGISKECKNIGCLYHGFYYYDIFNGEKKHMTSSYIRWNGKVCHIGKA